MIRKITKEEVIKLLGSNGENNEHNYEPLGNFYLEESGTYVGIDNEDGCALVEEFEDEDTCISWLNREFEVGDE